MRVVCTLPTQRLGAAGHRQQPPDRQFELTRGGLEQPEISIQQCAHSVPVIKVGIKKDSEALGYLYFEDEPQRQMSMKRLSRDEAFLIAVNIAKLPSVPRQILKDIPRAPNSASRDD